MTYVIDAVYDYDCQMEGEHKHGVLFSTGVLGLEGKQTPCVI